MSLFASGCVWTEPGTEALRHSPPLPASRNFQPFVSGTRRCSPVCATVCARVLVEANDTARREAQSAYVARASIREVSLDRRRVRALKIFVKARGKVIREVI